MGGFTLVTISYVLLGIFLVAFVARSVRLARLPVHVRWELAPVPHERGKSHYGGSYFEEYEWWTKPRSKSHWSELRYMLLEIVFLKAVWEHNRSLWWFSFPFHAGLYLLVAATALLAAGALASVVGLGWTGWGGGVTLLAWAGFIPGVIGAAGLLVKRVVQRELADYTTPESLFNLALLLAVFATGVGVLARGDYFATTSAFTRALLTADTSVAPGVLAAVHLLLALAFLAYLPFSRMMHFVAKYFTYHQVRWDDAPMKTGSRMEREVQQLLQQPVTWAAPHLGANGTKNWVDIATDEVRS